MITANSLDIASALTRLVSPDDVCEIRFIGYERSGKVHAGWIRGSQISAVASKIAGMSLKSEGVYFTPQVVSVELLKRRTPGHFANLIRLADGSISPRLTHDDDIVARRYLLIDVDPERPPGLKREATTDDEKAASFHILGGIRTHFSAMAWPAPLVIDSGNGYHLYYRLPIRLTTTNYKADGDCIARLLATLATKFNTPDAKIDTLVYNPARLMKIPGTFARKGANSPARPHRPCRILEVPDDWLPG